MSGAAGLAAARRRRGQPQPVPQRMPEQNRPPPVPHAQAPPNPEGHGVPTTPMTILHQHHIKLEEHDKLFQDISSKLDETHNMMSSRSRGNEMTPSLLDRINLEVVEPMQREIKNNMIDPLENDLQSVLSGYQLKIDMLTSTLNSQQNYILELNTTLLGVVNQMTKLLAMKEQVGESSSTFSKLKNQSTSTNEIVLPASEVRTEAGYEESEPPAPFSESGPVATFTTSPNEIAPSFMEDENNKNIMDVDEEDPTADLSVE